MASGCGAAVRLHANHVSKSCPPLPDRRAQGSHRELPLCSEAPSPGPVCIRHLADVTHTHTRFVAGLGNG